jgi:hypothetical protein
MERMMGEQEEHKLDKLKKLIEEERKLDQKKWVDEFFQIIMPGDDSKRTPIIKIPDGRTCQLGPRHMPFLPVLLSEGLTPDKAARIFLRLL